MKQALSFFAGIVGVLLALSLFGHYGFIVGAILYTIALYAAFFLDEKGAFSYLVGITAGYELLGTSHPGEAVLLAFIASLIIHVFFERLRFTSPFARYIVGLFLLLMSYALVLYSWHSFFQRLIPLLGAYIILCLISYALSTRNRRIPHELF